MLESLVFSLQDKFSRKKNMSQQIEEKMQLAHKYKEGLTITYNERNTNQKQRHTCFYCTALGNYVKLSPASIPEAPDQLLSANYCSPEGCTRAYWRTTQQSRAIKIVNVFAFDCKIYQPCNGGSDQEDHSRHNSQCCKVLDQRKATSNEIINCQKFNLQMSLQ